MVIIFIFIKAFIMRKHFYFLPNHLTFFAKICVKENVLQQITIDIILKTYFLVCFLIMLVKKGMIWLVV